MTGLEPPRCVKPEYNLYWRQVCLTLAKLALSVRSSEKLLDKNVGHVALTFWANTILNLSR